MWFPTFSRHLSPLSSLSPPFFSFIGAFGTSGLLNRQVKYPNSSQSTCFVSNNNNGNSNNCGLHSWDLPPQQLPSYHSSTAPQSRIIRHFATQEHIFKAFMVVGISKSSLMTLAIVRPFLYTMNLKKQSLEPKWPSSTLPLNHEHTLIRTQLT